MENAEKLTNAKIIMDDCNVDKAIQEQVCVAINNIGYSKRLKGHSPTTLEGKIVSDVDMCDALGANGILRVYTYSMKNVLLSRKRTLSLYLVEQAFPSLTTGKIKTYEL